MEWHQLEAFPGTRVRVDAAAEIAKLRASGTGWPTVARRLNQLGVPTPSGRGRWHAATAQRYADPNRWAAYMRGYRARR